MANGAGLGALMSMGLGIMLLAIVVGIIVGTLVLMLSTRLVEKFTPSFGKALVAEIAWLIGVFIVSLILGMVLGSSMFSQLVVLVINFFVGAWIIQQLITPPGGAVAGDGAMAMTAGAKMSYARACVVALVDYVICLVIGTPLHGFPTTSWLALLGLALVTQVTGHLSVAYSLGKLPVSVTSVALLGQAPITAILAVPLLGESLSVLQILGGTLVLFGIYVVNRREREL